MKYYRETIKFVESTFNKSGKFSDELRHFWRTAYWLKKLYPKADEAMLIAAVSHDIERAFRKWQPKGFTESRSGFMHKPTVIHHCREGARIVGEFLKVQGAPKKMIAKATMMIRGHEFGGNKWQNLLKNADSVSYFENQLIPFISKWARVAPEDLVRNKFEWMYTRISSAKARRLAKPMYEKSIRYLNKFYKSK